MNGVEPRIPAPALANDRKKLVEGEVNRQAILEIALDWFSEGEIDDYMDKHAKDTDAQELSAPTARPAPSLGR